MLLAALVAAAVCSGMLPVLVPALHRRAVLDHPGARSSHSVPTPRGGGLALAVAICVGAVVADTSRPTLTVIGVVLLCGGVGLLEDLKGVPIVRRLLVHGVAGLALGGLYLSGRTGAWAVVMAAVLAVLVVAVVNAVNFMDGINGISAATGLVGGIAYGFLGVYQDVPALSVLGAAIAAASLAFLPWNAPRARVFLGDVGSYALGAALAGCVVVALDAGLPVEAAGGPLALYLADTGIVLLRRFVRREDWREAHRSHAYQRLTDTGLGHTAVSTVVLLVTAFVAGLGMASLQSSTRLRVLADAIAALLLLGYLVSPSLRTDVAPG